MVSFQPEDWASILANAGCPLTPQQVDVMREAFIKAIERQQRWEASQKPRVVHMACGYRPQHWWNFWRYGNRCRICWLLPEQHAA